MASHREVREWLRERHYVVKDTGRVPTELWDIYTVSTMGVVPEGMHATYFVAKIREWLYDGEGEPTVRQAGTPLTEDQIMDFMTAPEKKEEVQEIKEEETAKPDVVMDQMGPEITAAETPFTGIRKVTAMMNNGYRALVQAALHEASIQLDAAFDAAGTASLESHGTLKDAQACILGGLKILTELMETFTPQMQAPMTFQFKIPLFAMGDGTPITVDPAHEHEGRTVVRKGMMVVGVIEGAGYTPDDDLVYYVHWSDTQYHEWIHSYMVDFE